MSTQQKYSKRDFGRSSQTDPGSDMLREQWRIAAELNQVAPGEGEWVPREAIFLRHDIMPRGDYLNYRRVEEYAQIQRQMPPIRVQRDTFVLIDGHHRLSACYDKNYSELCIRIVEEDVPDDELREAAFHANVGHGESFRPRDRAEHLKYLLAKKGDTTSDVELARVCGMNRHTVAEYREKMYGPKNARPEKPITRQVPNLQRLADTTPDSELDITQNSDSKPRKLPNNGRDLRREPLAEAQGWPDDDLPARQADENEETYEVDEDGNMVYPDDWGNELHPEDGDGVSLQAPSTGGGERVSLPRDPAPQQAPAPAERGTVPPTTSALPAGAAREDLAASADAGAREDLDQVILWLKAMPNVGNAMVMVSACRDAGERRLVHFLASGGNTLCADMIDALAVLA